MDLRSSATRLARLGAGVTAALGLIVALAAPAGATVPDEMRLSVLNTWSQPTAESRNSWLAADSNQAAWADYAFDWSTDLCSYSPDNPFGFPFELSCARHDFGYRNFKLVGMFPANKDRIDDAFYADLTAVCDNESWYAQPACYGLAWTYYEAVHEFGSLSAVKQADLDRARQQLAEGERAAGIR
jgi:phospholipase A2-like protein